MKQYIDLVKDTLANGEPIQTRNGERLTVYGRQLRFDLAEGFPIVTTKRIPFRMVAGELCWFLNGQTNTKQLNDWGINIWDANAAADGELGPIYGYQWRSYGGSDVDQIKRSIRLLKKSPESTRNVVIAWNPVDMDKMKLPPCHFGFQVHSTGEKVILQASIRSSDLMVGLSFNIASYALLCHLFAEVTGKTAAELIIDLGNVHIYAQHYENAKIQVEREPLPLPKLVINEPISDDLYGLQPTQFSLVNYKFHPALAYEMIV